MQGPRHTSYYFPRKGQCPLTQDLLPKVYIISRVIIKSFMIDPHGWIMVRPPGDWPDALTTITCFCFMIHDDDYLMLSYSRIPSSSMPLTFASKQIQKLRNQKYHCDSLARGWSRASKWRGCFWAAKGEERTEPEPSISQAHSKGIVNK